MSDALPVRRERCSADVLIGGDYYEEIVSDKKTPIGNSGLYLRSSKLGQILTGATVPKGTLTDAYNFPRIYENPVGCFSVSRATKTELTKQIHGKRPLTKDLPRKLMSIGSQWTPKITTDTKLRGLCGVFGKPKPIKQTQLQVIRNKNTVPYTQFFG